MSSNQILLFHFMLKWSFNFLSPDVWRRPSHCLIQHGFIANYVMRTAPYFGQILPNIANVKMVQSRNAFHKSPVNIWPFCSGLGVLRVHKRIKTLKSHLNINIDFSGNTSIKCWAIQFINTRFHKKKWLLTKFCILVSDPNCPNIPALEPEGLSQRLWVCVR